jgi:hypothetical protein
MTPLGPLTSAVNVRLTRDTVWTPSTATRFLAVSVYAATSDLSLLSRPAVLYRRATSGEVN